MSINVANETKYLQGLVQQAQATGNTGLANWANQQASSYGISLSSPSPSPSPSPPPTTTGGGVSYAPPPTTSGGGNVNPQLGSNYFTNIARQQGITNEQAYANEILKKLNTNQPFDDPASAMSFMQSNPNLFPQTNTAPVTPITPITPITPMAGYNTDQAQLNNLLQQYMNTPVQTMPQYQPKELGDYVASVLSAQQPGTDSMIEKAMGQAAQLGESRGIWHSGIQSQLEGQMQKDILAAQSLQAVDQAMMMQGLDLEQRKQAFNEFATDRNYASQREQFGLEGLADMLKTGLTATQIAENIAQNKVSNQLDWSRLTGYTPQGQPTLSREEFATSTEIQRAFLTGKFRGENTMEYENMLFNQGVSQQQLNIQKANLDLAKVEARDRAASLGIDRNSAELEQVLNLATGWVERYKNEEMTAAQMTGMVDELIRQGYLSPQGGVIVRQFLDSYIKADNTNSGGDKYPIKTFIDNLFSGKGSLNYIDGTDLAPGMPGYVPPNLNTGDMNYLQGQEAAGLWGKQGKGFGW